MKTRLSHTAIPTPEEIRKYHEGTLSSERSYEIELMALENPLVADAVEGYADFSNWESIPAPKQFSKKGGSHRYHIIGWIAGLSIGVILALIFVPYLTHNELYEGEYVAETIAQEKQHLPPASVDTMYNTSQRVDSHVVKSEKKTVVQNVMTEELPSDSVAEVSGSTTVYEYLVSFNPPPISEPETPKNEPKLADTSSGLITLNGTSIYHVADYKIVDYRELRHDHWNNTEILNGTPASFETAKEKKSAKPALSIPYFRFVGNAVEQFSKNQYQLAYSQFQEILRQYPDDINALFYGGMCAFHLHKYDKAAVLFKPCISHQINTFNEEAEFYLAKSYLNSGKPAQGNSILHDIVRKNGFYAAQAKDLLQ